MNTATGFRTFATTAVLAIMVSSGCSNPGGSSTSSAEVDSLKQQVAQLKASNDMVNKNLQTFDTLDYTVFSNQEWTRLHESHANDIKVHWPDGHFTVGIEQHIRDLKAMFVYAPNTQIKQHPLRFGSGNLTGVTGVMTGTFSKPMPVGPGKFIQPTGKSFSINMCTIGVWKDGVMTEEYLFWDNKTYMEQLGIAK